MVEVYQEVEHGSAHRAIMGHLEHLHHCDYIGWRLRLAAQVVPWQAIGDDVDGREPVSGNPSLPHEVLHHKARAVPTHPMRARWSADLRLTSGSTHVHDNSAPSA